MSGCGVNPPHQLDGIVNRITVGCLARWWRASFQSCQATAQEHRGCQEDDLLTRLIHRGQGHQFAFCSPMVFSRRAKGPNRFDRGLCAIGKCWRLWLIGFERRLPRCHLAPPFIAGTTGPPAASRRRWKFRNFCCGSCRLPDSWCRILLTCFAGSICSHFGTHFGVRLNKLIFNSSIGLS